jgi:thymidylate kinase
MSQKKRVFICFTGIDGTGKSTLAHRVVADLAAKGVNASYVMGRFENFKLLQPLRWLVKKLLLSGKTTDHSAEGVKNKGRFFQNHFTAALWRQALIFDYLLQIAFKIRLPLLLGKSICADRYIYDTVVDLAVDTRLPVERMQGLLKSVSRFTPRPDRVFLIELSEELAFQRNLVKQDNLSLDYLRARRGLYRSFSRRPEVTVLDGSLTPDQIFQSVLQTLEDKKILDI